MKFCVCVSWKRMTPFEIFIKFVFERPLKSLNQMCVCVCKNEKNDPWKYELIKCTHLHILQTIQRVKT